MFDAKPEDRNTIALYVRAIERDHKTGPDGNLVEVHRITFGKKLSTSYEQSWEVPRLKKEDPALWSHVEPIYERWLKDNTITREGLPLDAWPAITKGQLKTCREQGLHTVEDLAGATDSAREKLGMGAIELIAKARAFMANRDQSAAANQIADLQKTVNDLVDQLKESQATIATLMAERGAKPQRPKLEKAA